jgi:hypothetical protein
MLACLLCFKEMVDWFNAIRAARFHYLQVAFPGAHHADVSLSHYLIVLMNPSVPSSLVYTGIIYSWLNSAQFWLGRELGLATHNHMVTE